MSKKVKVILGAIILVGGLLRIVALDQWPNGIHPDELVIGMSGYSIAKTGTDYRQTDFLPRYVTGLSPRFDNRTSVLNIYANAAAHLVAPTSQWTIRLPGALVGTLTIFLIFLLARLLFKNNAIALTAAGMLAFSPYHIFYSRFANDAIFSIALIVGATLLFRRALLSGRAVTFGASAALFALTLYGYHTYKMLTPLFVALLLVLYWKKLRAHHRGFMTWLAVGVIVALPAILIHMFRWATVNAEFAYVHAQAHGSSNPFFLIINLASFFLPQFWAGPRTGLIVEGIAAMIGAAWLLRSRHPEARFLLSWMLWFPLAAIFTDTVFINPNPLRGTSWLTVMPLLAGAGAVALVKHFRRDPPKLIAIGVIAFCLIVTGGTRVWSHWRAGDTPTCCFSFGSKIDNPIFEYVRQLPPDEEIIVSNWGQPVWQQGLIYAYLLPLPPRLVQTDATFMQQEKIPALDELTRVGRFRFCDLEECYQPNDGKLYIVRGNQMTNLPGTVLSRNSDGSVRFRAVRNVFPD
jgi:hypothetical protein